MSNKNINQTKIETPVVAPVTTPVITAEMLEIIKAQVKEEILLEMGNQEEPIMAKNEANLVADERTMKERILAEPKKTIFIPEDPNNPEDRQAISLNGVIFSVKRGVMVEVPQCIAEIWEHSYTTTKKVMKRIKVSNITDKNDLEVEG